VRPGNGAGSTSSGICSAGCSRGPHEAGFVGFPKSARDLVATLVRSIVAQPDPQAAWERHRQVVGQLEQRLSQAAELLDEAGPEILAHADFPKEHWRQLWSNHPQERLNQGIRCRTDVVDTFPNRTAVIPLVGAILAEQNDEWLVARRPLGVESLIRIPAEVAANALAAAS
jgi:putative transposase